jgi:hypothetical protein
VGFTGDNVLLHMTKGPTLTAVDVPAARCGDKGRPCAPATLEFSVVEDSVLELDRVLTWAHAASIGSLALANGTITMTVCRFFFCVAS